MNEAMENVCVSDATEVGPVPACVPGDFTVRLGDVLPDCVLRGLREEFRVFGGAPGAVSCFLTWMHFVEREARRLPELLEGLGRLKGALMAVAAAEGEHGG